MDDLTALGNDGIRRSFDEHYGTMMDVEQDPTGAMWAIHKQADRIEQLEANLAKAVGALRRIADDCEANYPPSHGAIKHDARVTLAELKGQNDE